MVGIKEIKIAIAGQFRAGKDTVFELMRGEFIHQNSHKKELSIRQFAFGDYLKSISQALFPERFSGKKDRDVLQKVGQFARSIEPNVWIAKVDTDLKMSIEHKRQSGVEISISFITDARQPNEFEYCRENNFHLIKVIADKEIRKRRAEQDGDSFSEDNFNHETEQHVLSLDADYTIENNEDLHSLIKRVEEVVEDILRKEGI